MKCKYCKYWKLEDELPGISEFMECRRIDENDPDWWKKWHFRGPDDSCEYGEKGGMTMDDLISRKAAIEAFDRISLQRIKGLGLELLISVSDAKNILEGMKAVDAAPVKHGRWVMMDGMKPPEWHHHHQCSVCESYAPMKPPYGGREEFPPFCPACGARMGGVENEHG